MSNTFLQAKLRITIVGCILILFISAAAEGQSVSGIVRSATGNQPLPGVTVHVSNSNRGTVTDNQGHYQLSGLSSDDTLVFSFVGYEKLEHLVGNEKRINVSLVATSASLDQLVVIGYGSERKSSLTSSVSKVENDKLDEIPVGEIGSALYGRLSGVHISTPQSEPGQSPIIRIRGTGSISAGNQPLIVIDGFPGGSLSNLNMNDIKSIEVLKDASAAAIYGSRGSGGVILITTKSGIKGKPKFNFNAYLGISKAYKHHDWITGQEFYDYQVKYKNRDFYDAGGDTTIPVWGDPSRPANYQVNPIIKEGNTIWQNEVLETAPIQTYNLSVSGGSEDVQYYLSGGIKDQQGTLLNTWYKTYSAKAKFNVDLSPHVRIGLSLSPFYSKRRLPGAGIHALAKASPFVSPKQNADGSWPKALDYWGNSVSTQVSPFAILYGTHNYSSSFSNLAQGFIEVNILDGLRFKSSMDIDYVKGKGSKFREASATSTSQTTGSANGSESFNLINENVLSYNKEFKGGNNLNAILGASYQKEDLSSYSISALTNSFNNEIIQTLNNAQASPNSNTAKTHWGLISYYARVNYNYKQRYYFSGSFRKDGSSRFGQNNRWGNFPSLSAAWRISEESFFKVNLIDELKIRLSYGEVGNFNIGNFQYLGGIGQTLYAPDNKLETGQAQVNFANPDLRWEKTNSLDIGFDIGLFKNRIFITADFYKKRTKGLLYKVNIPSITGFSSSLTNTGDIQNSGIDLNIESRNIVGEFKWNTTFNLSHNENKVISLTNGLNEVIRTDSRGMGWILRVGEPMFSYYGYKLIGVFQDQNEIDKYPHLPGTKAGSGIYKDVNSDGKINDDDKIILGNFQPDFVLGLVNDFSWKGFNLSFTLQSSLGSKLYEEENLYYEGPTVAAMRRSLVDHQWWSPNDPGDGMSPSTALSSLSFVANSDYYLENASYLMLRNINLGYTFRNLWTNSINLSSLRVYLTANNLFMITSNDFHGYNPEGYTKGGISGVNSQPGFNVGSFPISRSAAIGINLKF